LQNSTDAKVIEQLEKDLTKQKDLLNQTIELLGNEDIKSLTDLQTLLKGKTLKELLALYETKQQSLENQLLSLAKTKIANQKEAKALVEELEEN